MIGCSPVPGHPYPFLLQKHTVMCKLPCRTLIGSKNLSWLCDRVIEPLSDLPLNVVRDTMKTNAQQGRSTSNIDSVLRLKELLARLVRWSDLTSSDPRVRALNIPFASEIPSLNEMICKLARDI